MGDLRRRFEIIEKPLKSYKVPIQEDGSAELKKTINNIMDKVMDGIKGLVSDTLSDTLKVSLRPILQKKETVKYEYKLSDKGVEVTVMIEKTVEKEERRGSKVRGKKKKCSGNVQITVNKRVIAKEHDYDMSADPRRSDIHRLHSMNTLRDVTVHNHQMKKETTSVVAAIQHQKDMIEKIKQVNRELMDDKGDLEEEIKRLRRRLNEGSAARDFVEYEEKVASETVSTHHQISLNAHINRQSTFILSVKEDQLNSLQTENERLQSDITSLREENDRLKRESDETRKELKQELKKAKLEISRLTFEIQKLTIVERTEIEMTRDSVVSVSYHDNNIEGKLRRFTIENENLNKLIIKLQTEIAELKKTNAEQGKQLILIQSQNHSEVFIQLEEKYSWINATNERLESQISKLNVRYSELKEDYAELEKLKEGADDDLDEAESTINELRNEVALLRRNHGGIDIAVENHTIENTSHWVGIVADTELKMTINKLERENNELRIELAELKVNDKENQGSMIHLELEIQQHKVDIVEYEREIRRLRLQSVSRMEWRQWNWQTVLLWMMTIEKGRFKDHEHDLHVLLRDLGITGSSIRRLTEESVMEWNLKMNTEEKKALWMHIYNDLHHSRMEEQGEIAELKRKDKKQRSELQKLKRDIQKLRRENTSLKQ